jgi:hypothetical protein
MAAAIARLSLTTGPAISEEGRLMQDMTAIRTALADLGNRLQAKRRELETEGVLHGPARVRAAELEVEHARLVETANERAKGPARAEAAAVLAAEAEALRRSFDHWFAEIDRGR